MASILRVNTLTDASSNNSTAMSTVFNGTAKAYLIIIMQEAYKIVSTFLLHDDGTLSTYCNSQVIFLMLIMCCRNNHSEDLVIRCSS